MLGFRLFVFSTFLGFSFSAFATPCLLSREEKVRLLVEENSLEFIESGKLKDIYGPEVVFQDPLQTVQGYDAAAAYLTETFKLLDFKAKLVKLVKQGNNYVAFWKADAQLKAGTFPIGQPFVYEGLSLLLFDRHNMIVSHRDYFDQFALYRIIPGFEQKAGMMLNDYIISQLPAPR